MKIYNIILILVMVFVFLTSCKKSEITKVSQPVNQTKISSEELDKQEAEPLLKELKQKNPFQSDHASGLVQVAPGSTDLKGIIWDSQRPFALIGDRVVVEGDSVDGKKVIKINKDSVVLEDDGRQVILRLEVISK